MRTFAGKCEKATRASDGQRTSALPIPPSLHIADMQTPTHTSDSDTTEGVKAFFTDQSHTYIYSWTFN